MVPDNARIQAEREFLRSITLLLSALAFIALGARLFADPNVPKSSIWVTGSVVVVMLAVAWLSSRLDPQKLGLGLVVVTMSVTFGGALYSGDSNALPFVSLPLAFAGVLFRTRVIIAITLGAIGITVVGGVANPDLPPNFIASFLSMLVLMGVVVIYGSRLRFAAEDARLLAVQETAAATRAALAHAFPATAILEDGRVRDASEAFASLFQPLDIEGAPLTALCREEDRGALVDATNAHIPIEIQCGSLVIEMFSAPFRGAHADNEMGALECVLAARDITPRHALQERAATSQRVLALGELAAGVAHEIQNPLTSLLLCVGFLEDGEPPEGDDIKEIQNSAERIRQTVNDLCALTNDGAEPAVIVDTSEPIDAALRIAEATIRAHDAKVVVEHNHPGPLYINAAPTRTSQAFAHMIVNAVKSLGDPPIRKAHVVLRTDVVGGLVGIRIQDNGPGIGDANVKRIFDPFFTTRDVGEGSGLGLSLAHNVISSAGGTLEVESTGADGTTFLATFQREEGEDGEGSGSSVAISRAPPNLRALVASDEPAIADAIGRLLGDSVDVTVASSGPDAARLLDEGDFHLLICDVVMRGVSGDTLLASLPPKCRGVALSGGAYSPKAQRFLAQWQGDVLAKPVTPESVAKLWRKLAREAPLDSGDWLPLPVKEE